MTGRHAGAVLRQLDRIFNRGTVTGLTERQLLERFVVERDEAAFTALVTQHGPMVLGVCRRILRDEHDIEDAFQATFLVLVRRARSVQRPELLGHWLYGVARRVAVRSRANTARLRAREQPLTKEPTDAGASPADVEVRAILDEELARLPESLRAPVVLCYLDGLTHDEAASRLRLPVGTVRSRMARARDLLRQRLAPRGIVATGAALTTSLVPQPVPAALLAATVQSALGFAARHATTAGVASAASIALAKGVLHAMTISKLKILGAAALASAFAFVGVQTFAQFGGMGGGRGAIGPASKTSDRQAGPLRSLDRIQAELVESARRNAELQKEVQDLRKELEAMRTNQSPPPAGKRADAEIGKRQFIPNAAIQSSAVSKKGSGGFGRGGQPGFGGGGGELVFGGGPKEPRYMRSGRFVFVTSPEGDKFTIYDFQTNTARPIRLSATKDAPLQVTPIISDRLLSLLLEGPRITRLYVFNVEDLTWYTQDLAEPVAGTVSMAMSYSIAAYGQGRHVYAFSAVAKRWGVLELPEGIQPTPVVYANYAYLEKDGNTYAFNETGEWKHTDVRAVVDAAIAAAEEEEKKDAKPKD